MHEMTQGRLAPLTLAALLGVAGCGADAPATDGAPATTTAVVDSVTFSAQAVEIGGFTIDTARSTAWQSAIPVPGRLMLDPRALETIGSITEGRVTRVLVRVGDRVRAGQILVAIHSHEIMDARSALVSAEAAVAATAAEQELAVANAARAERLLAARAMARAELERAQVARTQAQGAHQRARAELTRAEALVDHLAGGREVPAGFDEHEVLIRTPIAGVVTARDAQPGTVVLPGTPLLVVGDPQRLQLQLQVTATAAAAMQVGNTVRYVLTEAGGLRGEAIVSRLAPTVDTMTRTIEVLATPRGRVVGRAEAFVQAEVLGEGKERAISVPVAAAQALQGDTVVLVAEPRGAGLFVRAQPVRLGRRTRDRVEVLAGVPAGTAVVVNGAAIAKAELLKRRGAGE